jgi:DNA-binding MarR family transcriptional regulator
MPNRKPLPEEFYRKPGYLARQAYRISSAIFTEELSTTGLTGMQYGVLHVVDLNPGIYQNGVCDALHVDRSTLGSVIDRLEEKGWIRRGPHASDHRANALTLTAEGKSVAVEARRAERRAAARMLEMFEPSEQELLTSLLVRLVRHHGRYAGIPGGRNIEVLPKATARRRAG